MVRVEIRPARLGESGAITALSLRSQGGELLGFAAVDPARRIGEARSPSTGRVLPRLVIATA